MNRRCAPLLALVMAASVLFLPGVAQAAGATDPSLWIVDDVTARTYNVSVDGHVRTSFPTPGGALSSIAIDPVDGTLWGTKEGTATVAAKLVNYTRGGVIVRELELGLPGTLEGVDISFDPASDSFWLVIDEDDPTPVGQVFNVKRDGTLLSSFDAPSVSPQAIAYDRFDGTLWITDNAARVIYNVSTTGTVLRKIATNTFPFDGNAAPKAKELQGITVASADRLWFTARRERSGGVVVEPGRYIQITKGGTPGEPGEFVIPTIVSSFTAATYDAVADNPTGIAYDDVRLDLGAVTDFAVLALDGAKVKIDDEESGVAGDVALGPGSDQDFNKGLLAGTLFVDPAADNGNSHEVAITGGTVPDGLAAAANRALEVSRTYASLSPDQRFGDLKTTTTIVGGAGLNVIAVDKIELKDGTRLVLRGGAASQFVVNVREKMIVERSFVVLAGGVTPNNVVFHVLGDGDSTVKEGSVVSGIVVAPRAKLTVQHVGSLIHGAVVTGDELAIKDGGRVRSYHLALDPWSIGDAADLGVLALPGSKAKIQDASTSITGDVGIGPIAKQDFDRGSIHGSLFIDPYGDNTHSNEVAISGGTVVRDLSALVSDARDGSAAAAALVPQSVFGDMKSSTTIGAAGDVTVIRVKKIELKDGTTLTLTGTSASRFVINVTERLILDKAAVVLRGVLPQNVIFNVIGSSDSEIKNSTAAGLFVFPAAKVTVSGSRTIVTGALIGGTETTVKDGAAVVAIH